MDDIENYDSIYQLRNDEFPHKLLIGKLKIRFLNLKKFKKVKKDLNNKKHLYLSFFSKETNHRERKEMGKMDDGLKAAVKRIEEAIQSDEELRIYHKIELEKAIEEKRELKLKDTTKKLKESETKRKKEETKRMEEEAKRREVETKLIETVKRLKKIAMPIEQISEITDLPLEKIKKI